MLNNVKPGGCGKSKRVRCLVFVISCSFLLLLSACRTQESGFQEFSAQNSEVSLYVRAAGDLDSGNTLITIHGGPGMTSDYMLNLEKLAGPDLAVVTYDQRGVGRSTSPQPEPGNYTLDKYAEDLDAVRSAIGAGSVHLIGHSWGGIVAQRYASLYPERVRSLILVGSGPPTREGTLKCQEAIVQRVIELMKQGIIPDEQDLNALGWENLLRAYFSDPNFWFIEDDLGSAPLIDERTEQVNELTWTANEGYDLTAELASLDLRVLNLWGDDDPVRPIANPAIEAALLNADVETVVFSHCGHFWYECTDQFFPQVRAFLGLPEEQ